MYGEGFSSAATCLRSVPFLRMLAVGQQQPRTLVYAKKKARLILKPHASTFYLPSIPGPPCPPDTCPQATGHTGRLGVSGPFNRAVTRRMRSQGGAQRPVALHSRRYLFFFLRSRENSLVFFLWGWWGLGASFGEARGTRPSSATFSFLPAQGPLTNGHYLSLVCPSACF